MANFLRLVCGDPRVREVVLEFRDSVKVGSSRVGDLLRKLFPILSLYVIISLVLEGREVVRVLWDRAPDPLVGIVIAGACIAPILAAYLAFNGYLTLEARRRLRAPIVSRPHSPVLLLPLFLPALLHPGHHVHHWPETRVALAYLYAGCVLFPALALTVMWVLRARVVWCWKSDLDEKALERFVERLPDGRYVPVGVIPYLPVLGVIPTIIVALVLPSLMTYAVIAGTILVLALAVCLSLLPKEELPEIVGVFNRPWREGLYTMAFMTLILEKSFWLIIKHSHP